MKTNNPLDLTLELRSTNGMVAEFCQTDPERIQQILRLLASPRLFTQTELILASEHYASTFNARAMDVILVRTGAALPKILPLNSPAGPVDISEVNDACGGASTEVHEREGHRSAGTSLRTFRVEVQTLGGWSSVLEVCAQVQGTVQDRRLTFAHVFHVPVIPFHLRAGGIGFINPANLSSATAYPPPDSLPETALPLELLRWTPSRPSSKACAARPIQP